MDSGITIHNLTVVIPTFNRVDMLKKILDTIPRSIRVIVSDNGTGLPDDFKLDYPEFTFFKTPRLLEALENWNNCIDLVQTEWFTIPSDDDLYYSNSFGLISKFLGLNANADLLVFGHHVINENDKIISSWIPAVSQFVKPPISFLSFKYGVDARFPGLVFKKSIVVANGCFDTSYKTTAGDSKLIQKCLLNGTVSFIPEIVAAYRVWPNNSTSLTMGTTKWLNEIDRWQDEILSEATNQFAKNGLKLSTRNIKDEVFARNLVGGLYQKKKNKGYFNSINFALENRYPFHAKLITQLRIIKALF